MNTSVSCSLKYFVGVHKVATFSVRPSVRSEWFPFNLSSIYIFLLLQKYYYQEIHFKYILLTNYRMMLYQVYVPVATH